MEKKKLTIEEEKSLSASLIAFGTDLLNDKNFTKEDAVKLYLYSQQNLKIILDRIERAKSYLIVSIKPETKRKLKLLMDTSRIHVFVGGQKFKTEDETISYLLDVALTLGIEYLDKISENYESVSGSMKPEDFDNEKERKVKINEEFEKEEKRA